MEILSIAFVFALLIALLYFRSRGVREVEEKQEHDLLAEAEVYLAYGRKQQAIELLEHALGSGDTRPEIRQRLAKLRGSSI